MTTFDLDNVRWRPARNDSGEDIPAHAAVRLKSFDTTTGEHVIEKPDADGMFHRVAVIGPVGIPDGASGLCSFDFPNYVRWGVGDDSPGDPPVLDDVIGTKADEWGLSNAERGFLCLADGEEDTRRVYAMLDPFAVSPNESGSSADGGACTGVTLEQVFQCSGEQARNVRLCGVTAIVDAETGEVLAEA